MDPLTITCTVVSLTAKCLNTAKTLHSLKERYKDAVLTITAMSTECTVVSASLGLVQSLVLKKPDALQSSLSSRPELVEIFDTCLTGCVLVFSILDGEVQKLNARPESVGKRAEIMWRDTRMTELLQQIRGQQTALATLTQALQLEKIDEIQTLLTSKKADLDLIVQRTLSLRKENPTIKSPTSIMHPKSEDGESLFSFNYSFASSTEFDFDDVVINSVAYRKHLASLKQPLSVVNEDGEDNKAADIEVAEQRYSARLQHLVQQCSDLEQKLKAADTDVVRLRDARNFYQARSRSFQKEMEELTATNEKVRKELDDMDKAAHEAAKDKQLQIIALQAESAVHQKAERWMAEFDRACKGLKQQFDDIVPAIHSYKQRDEQVHAYMATNLQKSDEEVARLFDENKQQAGRIEELEQKLDRTKSLSDGERKDWMQAYNEREKQLQQLKREVDTRDAELSKYKRLELALQEQLHAISSSEVDRESPSTPIAGSKDHTVRDTRGVPDKAPAAPSSMPATKRDSAIGLRDVTQSPPPKTGSGNGGVRKSFQFRKPKQQKKVTDTVTPPSTPTLPTRVGVVMP